jgi:hypothetical protein
VPSIHGLVFRDAGRSVSNAVDRGYDIVAVIILAQKLYYDEVCPVGGEIDNWPIGILD